MKQVIQNYSTGVVELADVPMPLCPADNILIRNTASLVSIGTERSIIELGRKNLLEKARTRPDLVKRFMEKAKTEGFMNTFRTALQVLDKPVALGYSCAGTAVETGANIHAFSAGDRIACIGAGFASHAEYVAVPEMLCSRIPDGVGCEEASFGMLGIIALNGIRCAKLTFGESVGVIGLGLLGLLTVQMLKAYGCKAAGMDIDPRKTALAKDIGADYVFDSEKDFRNCLHRITNGVGADAVIITASTQSDAPVNTAVDVARYAARIVLVGVADIHPARNEMWHKEVEIIVSKAGGPGTFDPFYENKGVDYPAGYVRWTQKRNLEEFLRLIQEGKINVKPLITHRFKIEKAQTAYKEILDNSTGLYIGVVLEYPGDDGAQDLMRERKVQVTSVRHQLSRYDSGIRLGVVGAGLFGKALLLPALKNIGGVTLHTLATATGANAYHSARKFGFANCATDYRQVLDNEEINAVMIIVPHSLHAAMVIEALKCGKHVFVEKPLCVHETDLKGIMDAYSSVVGPAPVMMVGYNRRFSPHSLRAAGYLKNRHDPLVINYRVNAGFVPAGHWVHSEEEGGSRIVGEVCHFVDMLQFLSGSNPSRVYAERISGNNKTSLNSDNAVITLKFKDGSIGTITYCASGDRSYSREQVEIFSDGKAVIINDYKETRLHASGGRKVFRTPNQEMGYVQELQNFFAAVRGIHPCGISSEDIFYSTAAVFKIHDALSEGRPEEVVLPR